MCHSDNAGVERASNKSQRTKLTLVKKILPPLLPGFELATFRSRVRYSYQQAIPAPLGISIQCQNTGRTFVLLVGIKTWWKPMHWPSSNTEIRWWVHKSLGILFSITSLPTHKIRRWGTKDAEIKTPSFENLALSRLLSFKPWVGQSTALTMSSQLLKGRRLTCSHPNF